MHKECPSLYTGHVQIGHWLGHMCTLSSSFPAWALQVLQLGHGLFTFVNKSVSKLGTPTFIAVKAKYQTAIIEQVFARKTTILSKGTVVVADKSTKAV